MRLSKTMEGRHTGNHTNQVGPYTEMVEWSIRETLKRWGSPYEQVFENYGTGWKKLVSLVSVDPSGSDIPAVEDGADKGNPGRGKNAGRGGGGRRNVRARSVRCSETERVGNSGSPGANGGAWTESCRCGTGAEIRAGDVRREP